NLEDEPTDRALKLLTRTFDYVIADAGRDITPLSFRIFDNSSLIFLVTTSNLLSLNQGSDYSNRLRSLQFGNELQRLVINEFDPRGLIGLEIIEQKYRMKASVLLPSDAAAFAQTLSAAKPLQVLNPKHPYLKGVDEA